MVEILAVTWGLSPGEKADLFTLKLGEFKMVIFGVSVCMLLILGVLIQENYKTSASGLALVLCEILLFGIFFGFLIEVRRDRPLNYPTNLNQGLSYSIVDTIKYGERQIIILSVGDNLDNIFAFLSDHELSKGGQAYVSNFKDHYFFLPITEAEVSKAGN